MIAKGQSNEDLDCYSFKCYGAITLNLEESYVKGLSQLARPVIASSLEKVNQEHFFIFFCDDGKLRFHDGHQFTHEFNFMDWSEAYNEPKGTTLLIFNFINDVDYTLSVGSNVLSNAPSEVIISIYPFDYKGGDPKPDEHYFYWFCRKLNK